MGMAQVDIMKSKNWGYDHRAEDLTEAGGTEGMTEYYQNMEKKGKEVGVLVATKALISQEVKEVLTSGMIGR